MEQFLISIKRKKKINIINPRKKVLFLIDQKINKEEIQLQLTKLNSKSPELEGNKIESFTILISKKGKFIGHRRIRDRQIIDTVFIRELQNFDKYDIPNPIEIKKEEDRLSRNLQKYHNKNYIYRFVIDGLLFSGGITNESNVLFIRCNDLSNISEAIINEKPHKSLGIINLEQIKH